jgi:hypothetical protein
LLRRVVAGLAVNELVIAANKERIAETEETDRGSDLLHMSRIKLTKLSTSGSKLFEPKVSPADCGSSVSIGRRELRAAQLDLCGCSLGPALNIIQKQQINTTEMNAVDSQSGRVSRQRLAMGYALAQTSPRVAAPGFDVNKWLLWPPLLHAGDGLR